MTLSYGSREQDSLYLPQYGFSETLDFARLIECNRFLFRVYTPKECSPFFDDSEPFFIAPKFDERCRNPSPGGPKNWEVDGLSATSHATYRDVVRHMDWTTRSLSPYISTSFSAIWSIWEAIRRYHHGVKQDVQIAIIDASVVSNRAVTAACLLSKAPPHERRDGHWKWFRYSQESQTVLIYGAIPGTAILASVPLSDLLRKLPLYFLNDGVDRSNPFSRLAWDYSERKPNFRIFCRNMTNNYLRLSHEVRLQDAATNAVELAIAFLRPWFHQAVVDDIDSAIESVSALAFSIAQWPCQWWIREHTEIWDLVLGTVGAIAEELREKNKAKDVTRLREVMDELEHTLVECQGRLQHARSEAVKYHKLVACLKQRRAKECQHNLPAPLITNHFATPNASPAFKSTWRIDETQVPLPEPPLSTIRSPSPNYVSPTQHASPEYSNDWTVDVTKIPLPDSPLPIKASLSPNVMPTPQICLDLNDTWTIDETKIPLPESPLPTKLSLQPNIVPPTSHASIGCYDNQMIDEAKIPLHDSPLSTEVNLSPRVTLHNAHTSSELTESRSIDESQILLSESQSSAEASLPPALEPFTSTPRIPRARPVPRPLSLILALSQSPSLEDYLSSSPTLSSTLSTLTAEEDETSTVLSTPPGKEIIKLLESPRLESQDLPSKDEFEPESSISHYTLISDGDVVELEEINTEEDYVCVSDEELSPIQRMPVFVETATYVATGFLVGALITLSLLSHRRVALLNLT